MGTSLPSRHAITQVGICSRSSTKERAVGLCFLGQDFIGKDMTAKLRNTNDMTNALFTFIWERRFGDFIVDRVPEVESKQSTYVCHTAGGETDA
jgi:hypothetical protein